MFSYPKKWHRSTSLEWEAYWRIFRWLGELIARESLLWIFKKISRPLIGQFRMRFIEAPRKYIMAKSLVIELIGKKIVYENHKLLHFENQITKDKQSLKATMKKIGPDASKLFRDKKFKTWFHNAKQPVYFRPVDDGKDYSGESKTLLNYTYNHVLQNFIQAQRSTINAINGALKGNPITCIKLLLEMRHKKNTVSNILDDLYPVSA